MDVNSSALLVNLFCFPKKIQLPFSQFSLIQVISTIGLIFLLPQFFYEKSQGSELVFNLPTLLILSYVVFLQL